MNLGPVIKRTPTPRIIRPTLVSIPQATGRSSATQAAVAAEDEGLPGQGAGGDQVVPQVHAVPLAGRAELGVGDLDAPGAADLEQEGRATLLLKGTNLTNETIQQHVYGDILKRSIVAELQFFVP